MKRKGLALFLVLSLAAGVLSGCGAGQPAEKVSQEANESAGGEPESSSGQNDDHAAVEETAETNQGESGSASDETAEEPEIVGTAFLTKITRYKNDGTVREVTEYEYDAAGNQIQEKSGGGSGTEYILWQKEYDDAGSLIKDISYSYGRAGLEQWSQVEYDASGNKTRSVIYNADGTVNYG